MVTTYAYLNHSLDLGALVSVLVQRSNTIIVIRLAYIVLVVQILNSSGQMPLGS